MPRCSRISFAKVTPSSARATPTMNRWVRRTSLPTSDMQPDVAVGRELGLPVVQTGGPNILEYATTPPLGRWAQVPPPPGCGTRLTTTEAARTVEE